MLRRRRPWRSTAKQCLNMPSRMLLCLPRGTFCRQAASSSRLGQLKRAVTTGGVRGPAGPFRPTALSVSPDGAAIYLPVTAKQFAALGGGDRDATRVSRANQVFADLIRRPIKRATVELKGVSALVWPFPVTSNSASFTLEPPVNRKRGFYPHN